MSNKFFFFFYLEFGLDMSSVFLFMSNVLHFGLKRSYVVYPPEAPRPPSPEEMREMARELARKNNNR